MIELEKRYGKLRDRSPTKGAELCLEASRKSRGEPAKNAKRNNPIVLRRYAREIAQSLER